MPETITHEDGAFFYYPHSHFQKPPYDPMNHLDLQRFCALSATATVFGFHILVCAPYSSVISTYLPSLTPHNLSVLTILTTQSIS